MRSPSLTAALGGLLVVAVSLQIATGDVGPPGTCCQPIDIDHGEDARGYVDSCLRNSRANCSSVLWCAICSVPDGWYCADWSEKCPPESVCYGFPVAGNVKTGGGCDWGTGNDTHPRPNGECYCPYDEQQNPSPLTVYDCSS
jgi:hypothetical protein